MKTKSQLSNSKIFQLRSLRM